ncbi:MAG: tetratricopeptide repeat protein [Treponema sp.]|nr:tetratricopeptide repeat protein [Treponema sp.]
MAENQANRSYAPRSGTPGEKPALNEEFKDYSSVKEWKWDFPKPGASVKNKPRQTQSPAGGAGKGTVNDSRLKKGMRLYLTRRWEDALKEFLLVDAEAFSGDQRMELAYYLGLCCTKLERFDEALLHFEKVIAIGESPVWIYQCRLILAYIYITTGRAKMAEAELSRLQDSGLESVMLYNTLAYAAYAQKNYLSAVEMYEKALDIDKDNATALNSLGYILADTGLDKLKGLRLCRKAVDKNPANAAYLDSLGWASYQCGRLAEARKWLSQAIDLAPQEKEIVEHLKEVAREVL